MRRRSAAAPPHSHNMTEYSFSDVLSGAVKASGKQKALCDFYGAGAAFEHAARLALRSDALDFLCFEERATVFRDGAASA